MRVVIVITTHRRNKLLKRTLMSVKAAKLPSNFEAIYVLENDTERTSDVIEDFPELPLVYRFFPEANKSRALNWLLPELTGQHLIFLDDDVLIPPCLFTRYLEAFKKSEENVGFWGGAVVPDFETLPPEWLLKKLPRSVTGWKLGEQSIVVRQPDFLGCNWAASTDALRAVNGFDESRGPGANTISVGQEYSAQRRLLEHGYLGMYVPGPPVKHFVPRNRCSPEWALARAEKNGRGFGLSYASRLGTWIYWPALLRLWWAKVRFPNNADSKIEADFLRMYEVRRWSGFVEGVSRTVKAT